MTITKILKIIMNLKNYNINLDKQKRRYQLLQSIHCICTSFLYLCTISRVMAIFRDKRILIKIFTVLIHSSSNNNDYKDLIFFI